MEPEHLKGVLDKITRKVDRINQKLDRIWNPLKEPGLKKTRTQLESEKEKKLKKIRTELSKTLIEIREALDKLGDLKDSQNTKKSFKDTLGQLYNATSNALGKIFLHHYEYQLFIGAADQIVKMF